MRNSRENCLKFLFQQEFLTDPKFNFDTFKAHFIKPDINDTQFIEKVTFHVLENKSKME